jgi:hypothetical protein
MAPFFRMSLVPLNRAMVWVYACELNVLAEIVAAVPAQKTLPTRDTRFDSNTVACQKVRTKDLI